MIAINKILTFTLLLPLACDGVDDPTSPRGLGDKWYRGVPKSMSLAEFEQHVDAMTADCELKTRLATMSMNGRLVSDSSRYASVDAAFYHTDDQLKCMWAHLDELGADWLCHGTNQCPDGMLCNQVTKICE